MRRLAILGVMLLTGMWPAASAFAQQFPGQGSFNQTADATAFSPIPASPDGLGHMTEGAVSDGNLSGTPISGSFHVQETRSGSPDGSGGSVQGQFTFRDGSGNSLFGTMSGQYTLAPTSTSASGQYTISGGTGSFAGAMGTGSFTEVLALPDGTPTLTFAGAWSGQPGSPAAAQLLGTALRAGYTTAPIPGQSQVVYVPVPDSVFNQINRDNDNDDRGNGNKNDRWAENNGHDNGRHRGHHDD